MDYFKPSFSKNGYCQDCNIAGMRLMAFNQSKNMVNFLTSKVSIILAR